MPWRELEDHVDAGRDRVGDHLEISWLHSPGRSFGRRVLLGGDDEQLAAGGYRNEDDPRGPEHEEHDRLEGDFGRPRAEHLSRPGEDWKERRRRAQLLAVRFAAHRRPVRRAHVPIPRHQEFDGKGGARSLNLEDRGRPDLLLPAARDFARRRDQPDRGRFLSGSVPSAADGVCGRSAEVAQRDVGGQRWITPCSSSRVCTFAAAAGKSCEAWICRWTPVRCTPSWDRTARERARSRARWPDILNTKSLPAASATRDRICSLWIPKRGRVKGCSWPFSTRSRFRASTTGTSSKRRSTPPATTPASRSSTPSSSWRSCASACSSSTWIRA